jgi:HK97 family phage major capsid protein
MEKLRELQQHFNELVKQLREEQGRETPDKTKAENLSSEIRSLAAEIETEEAIVRMKDGVAPAAEARHKPGEESGEEVRASKDYSKAFDHYLRTADPEEVRSLTTTTEAGTPKAGLLAPMDWDKTILERKTEAFLIRGLASVETSSLDKTIPVEGENGVSAWIDEEGDYGESDEKFEALDMSAWKLGRIIKASEELLEDEQYNLEGYIQRKFSLSQGRAEEAAYFSGDGVKKPRGLLVDSLVGKETATSAGFTYDELLDFWGSLKDGYARGAKVLMNRTTLIAIMKLKDGNGEYIYKPSPTPGQLGYLVDAPILCSEYMPTIAAGAKVMAYGDFSYYRIMDRSGVFVQRLVERYADKGQVGFRIRQRTDARLVLPEAVKTLKIKAA